MWTRRWTKYVAGLVMIVMVVPGAFLVAGALDRRQEDDQQAEAGREQACASLVDRLVTALDRFTVQFDGLTALSAEKIPPMPSMGQLRTEAAAFDRQLAQADCREADARTAIVEWREAEASKGPLAEAVRTALAANVVDVVDGRGEPLRYQVEAGEDLAAVLSGMPSGATVVLPEGRFTLDRTVAFVQDITIRGAGRGRTTVASSAPAAGLVLASQVSLRMTGVRVEHRGGGTASVLVLRGGSAELDDVQISGASTSASGDLGARAALAGGSGIVVAGANRLLMTRSTSSGNAVGGLLVATGSPKVSDSTFRGNDVCGVCYLGESAGRLIDSLMVGNGAGVMLGERSAPVVERNRVQQNDQAGLVVEGAAAPVVRRNAVRGNGGIGVAVYGTAAPTLTGNILSEHDQAGILLDVAADSTPVLLENVLRDNGSAGIVFMRSSGGRASGNTCAGARFGLVLDGSATPDLDRNDCAVQDQRPNSSTQ